MQCLTNFALISPQEMLPLKIRCEEAWTKFLQWTFETLEKQFGHLAFLTLSMNEEPTDDSLGPSEGSYLHYFTYLKKINTSHRLWSTYNLLSRCHKKKYGQGLNKWPNIYHMLEAFEWEEYDRRQADFYHHGVAYYYGNSNNNMAHFYNINLIRLSSDVSVQECPCPCHS